MSRNKKGMLLVISGFSGVGKGTIVKKIMEEHPDQFRLSISATSRAPRGTEQDGVEYFFKTKEEFEKMISDGLLLEHACYVGNYYGTPKEFVDAQLAQGYDVILEIEQQGAFNVKKSMPEAVLVFIAPPSIPELERRLRGRGTETEEKILSRLQRAGEEAEHIDRYDYYLINADVEACTQQLYDVIGTERLKTGFKQDEIAQLQKELGVYRKDDK